MSRVRSLANDLMPPLARRLYRRLRADKRAPAPARVLLDGAFATHAEAQAAAGTIEDYDDDRVVDGLFTIAEARRARLAERPLVMTEPIERVAVMLGLVATGRTELRVIDFGGGFGIHYWISRALLPASVRLHWHVVETAATARRAAELEAAADDTLAFHTELDDAARAAGAPDLIYSDGAVQALPDPLGLIGKLVACNARYVYLQRIGVADREVHTVARLLLSQHEPDQMLPPGVQDRMTTIPMTLVSRARVESLLATRYAVRARFGGATPIYKHAQFTMTFYGYFAELSGTVHADGTK
jgi:putative methyltransferase (TIGR04325 family)